MEDYNAAGWTEDQDLYSMIEEVLVEDSFTAELSIKGSLLRIERSHPVHCLGIHGCVIFICLQDV